MDGIRDEIRHLDYSLNPCLLALSRVGGNCPKTIAQLILVENLSNDYFGKRYYSIFNELVFRGWCPSAKIGNSPSCSFDDIWKFGFLGHFEQDCEAIFKKDGISKLYAISSNITDSPYCLLGKPKMTFFQKLKQQFYAPAVNNSLALTCCTCCDIRDYP